MPSLRTPRLSSRLITSASAVLLGGMNLGGALAAQVTGVRPIPLAADWSLPSLGQPEDEASTYRLIALTRNYPDNARTWDIDPATGASSTPVITELPNDYPVLASNGRRGQEQLWAYVGGSQVSRNSLFRLDPSTGIANYTAELYVVSSSGYERGIHRLVHDPVTGDFYAKFIFIDELYRVDGEYLDISLVPTTGLPDGFFELVVSKGVLYLLAQDGAELFRYDRETGVVESTSLLSRPVTAIAAAPDTGVIYGLAELDVLVTVDPETGAVDDVGPMGLYAPGQRVIGLAFLPTADTPYVVDFEIEDDFATPLINGQDISPGAEFGQLVTIDGRGPNAGAAIFDSTPTGPNADSRDLDLLVGTGNLLILQNDLVAGQAVSGLFDTPNDAALGGSIDFGFTSDSKLLSIDLVDVGEPHQSASVILTDAFGNTRTFSVPGGWTSGGEVPGGDGVRTLRLDSTAPQVGYAATAYASQVPGFRARRVVSMTVTFSGEGALDNLRLLPQ